MDWANRPERQRIEISVPGGPPLVLGARSALNPVERAGTGAQNIPAGLNDLAARSALETGGGRPARRAHLRRYERLSEFASARRGRRG